MSRDRMSVALSTALMSTALLSTMCLLPSVAASAAQATDRLADARPAPASTARTTRATELMLSPGQRGEFAGGHLHYLRLLDDSRCPPEVHCVQAGDASIALDFIAADGTRTRFQLHTGKPPRSHALPGGTVHLMRLDRQAAPQAQLRLDPVPGAE